MAIGKTLACLGRGRTAAFIALFIAIDVLAVDFVATQLMWDQLHAEKGYRIAHPQFHHTLRGNFQADDVRWGPYRHAIRTNALGFKDAEIRTVARQPDAGRRRVVVIGDSFVEAVGMSYADGFVGIFAASRPDLEVLNAGVQSYSPSVYFRKVKWLLDAGYAFDEAVVYIDLSDVQDEAVYYREAPDGSIIGTGLAIDYSARLADPPTGPGPKDAVYAPDRTLRWLREHFHFSFSGMRRLALVLGTAADAPSGAPAGRAERPAQPRRLLRGYWTVDANIEGYGELGVEGGIAKSIAYMDRLKRMLDARGIALSVGVYPWPDQIDYDREDSRHVVIWRDWCARNGCARFIDHFPDFFRYKEKHADWYEALFVPGDVHFSALGNRMVGERLAASMAPRGPQ